MRRCSAEDLRIERVALATGVRSIPAAGAAELVGRHTTGVIPAGTLLAPAMFDAAIPLTPGEVVVGASLDPGEAPLALLEIGATVELLDVAVAAPGPAADVAAGATSLGTGTVWAVEPIATGQLWLSVRVDRNVALTASLAAAQDTLRVVLVGAIEQEVRKDRQCLPSLYDTDGRLKREENLVTGDFEFHDTPY